MKDKKILKELRLGPMKSMKDEEYAMIEEEVNQKGIAGLKGYAKSIVDKSMREMAYAMKKVAVAKHGNHDQGSHGAWANGKYNTDDSEGEDSSEPKNYKNKKPKISYEENDTEGEFDNNADDPRWMDDMDILRPPKRSPK